MDKKAKVQKNSSCGCAPNSYYVMWFDSKNFSPCIAHVDAGSAQQAYKRWYGRFQTRTIKANVSEALCEAVCSKIRFRESMQEQSVRLLLKNVEGKDNSKFINLWYDEIYYKMEGAKAPSIWAYVVEADRDHETTEQPFFSWFLYINHSVQTVQAHGANIEVAFSDYIDALLHYNILFMSPSAEKRIKKKLQEVKPYATLSRLIHYPNIWHWYTNVGTLDLNLYLIPTAQAINPLDIPFTAKEELEALIRCDKAQKLRYRAWVKRQKKQ